MQHNNKLQVIQDALVAKDFPSAEKMAIEAIRKNNLNAQLWLYLTQALAFQGYGSIAKKTLERAWLLDPQAVWVEKAKRDIEHNDRNLTRTDIEELLKVKAITVCGAIIVKNEEMHIENCLSHLINAVDEVVIVDTGSTDRTLEIVQSFEKVKVVRFEWCSDFSAARNAAFPHIKSDWVLWVDADEYLFAEDIPSVREAAALFDDFRIPVLLRVGIVSEHETAGRIISYDAVRLFSMKYDLKFTSKIHEQIIITDEEMLINGAAASNPVKIRLKHFGYMNSEVNRQDKIGRNIKLLKEMVTEDAKNPLWYFFAGRELFVAGNFSESIEYLKQCIKMAENAPFFGRKLDAYTFLVRSYLEMGKFEEAEDVCAEAMKFRNDFPDIQYLYSLIQFKKANHYYKLAEDYVIRSKQAFNTYRDIVSPDCTIADWKADLLHGDIALFVSKLADAKVLYEKALVASPEAVKEQIAKKLIYIQEEKRKLRNLFNDSST